MLSRTVHIKSNIKQKIKPPPLLVTIGSRIRHPLVKPGQHWPYLVGGRPNPASNGKKRPCEQQIWLQLDQTVAD